MSALIGAYFLQGSDFGARLQPTFFFRDILVCLLFMGSDGKMWVFVQIMKEDDNNWPEPDRVGRQELEIVMGNEHISFTTSKIGSLVDVQSSKDPEGLRIFYYLVQVSSSICSLVFPTSSFFIHIC